MVIAIGNPLGFVGALSTGIVHAVGPFRGLGARTWIQADIRLLPGNSGGPLADMARRYGLAHVAIPKGLQPRASLGYLTLPILSVLVSIGLVPDLQEELDESSRAAALEAVVDIHTFDPAVVSYQELLEIFFVVHDPTTLNRQGADVGTQYRSAIFTHSDEQERTAEQVIEEVTAEGIWDEPIVTEVVPFETFYPAEEYHQEYFARNPNQPYCRIVVAPKVAKFRKQYLERLKTVGDRA